MVGERRRALPWAGEEENSTSVAVAARPASGPSVPDVSPAKPRRRVAWLPVAVVVVIAAATRFFAINSQSLWYDEGVSAGMVGQGPSAILRQAAADFHPPLYYLLLAAWARLFGDSIIALRGLSACAGILLVLLTWGLASHLFGRRPGWYAAAWATVAPLGIAFSQELRMYMPVAACVALAAYLAVRWLDRGKGNAAPRAALLIAYALAASVALYLQYVAALGLAAVGVYGLLRARGDALWYWLAANLAALLLFAPWLPTFHHQLAVGRTATTAQTAAGQVLSAAAGSLLVGADGLPLGNRVAVVGLAFLVLLGVRRSLADGRRGVLPLLLTVIPLLGVTAYAAWKAVYEVRYVLVALPGVAILGGLGIDQFAQGCTAVVPWLRSRPRSVLPLGLGASALVVAASGVADMRYYLAPLHPHDDYRGLAAAIVQQAEPGDAILLYPPGQSGVFDYYYRGPDPVIGMPLLRPPDATAVTTQLAILMQTHHRLWVVDYGASEADPTGIVTTWLSQHAFLSSHRWFGSPQLLLYVAASAPVASTAAGIRFTNGAELQSYAVSPSTAVPGGAVEITLNWRDQAPIADRYTVFTHVLDANDHVVAQHDGEPAGGTRPTTAWQPGETVQDRHGIVLPALLPAGTYTIEVGMYLPQGGTRAEVLDDAGHVVADHVVLGSIAVDRTSAR
jgi:mannosyltransferase